MPILIELDFSLIHEDIILLESDLSFMLSLSIMVIALLSETISPFTTQLISSRIFNRFLGVSPMVI